MRSQNTAVMSRRPAARSVVTPRPWLDVVAPSGSPQALQKCWPGATGTAQAGQRGASAAPQLAQKSAPAAEMALQAGHWPASAGPARTNGSGGVIYRFANTAPATQRPVVRRTCCALPIIFFNNYDLQTIITDSMVRGSCAACCEDLVRTIITCVWPWRVHPR
jgi:hypothetical protein